MVRAGCCYCFMEVTWHAIDQRRIDGGIFTTLGHDHLDYHGTIEAYAAVKQHFITEFPASALRFFRRGVAQEPEDERGVPVFVH